MPDITDGWIKLYRRLLRDTKFQRLAPLERYAWMMYLLIARWRPPFRGWLYDLMDEDPQPLSIRDRARLLDLSESCVHRIDIKLASEKFGMITIHPAEGIRTPSRIYIRNYKKYQPHATDDMNEACVLQENAHANAQENANENTERSSGEQSAFSERTHEGAEEDEAVPENTTTDAAKGDSEADKNGADFDENGASLSPDDEMVSIKKPKKKDKGRKSLSCTDVQAKDCAEAAPSAPFSDRHKELWAEWWSVFPGRTLREVIERYEAIGSMLPVKPVELAEANELERAILSHKDGSAYRALEMCLSSNPTGLAETGITCIIPAMRIFGARLKKPRKQREGSGSTKPKRRERPTV